MTDKYEFDDAQLKALISTAYQLGQKNTHAEVLEMLRNRTADLVRDGKFDETNAKSLEILFAALEEVEV